MRVIFLASTFLLCGCATNFGNSSNNQISQAKISDVLLKVKQEVGLYESQPWYPKAFLKEHNLLVACGDGNVQLTIDKVKVELTGSIDDTDKGAASAKIPILAAPPLNISPGLSGSYESTQGEDITYTYYLYDPNDPTDGPKAKLHNGAFVDPKGKPFIAAALQNLREAILVGSTAVPCMKNTPKGSDDTVVFTFALVQDKTATFGFDIYIINTSSSVDSQSKSGNTITVSFLPKPT